EAASREESESAGHRVLRLATVASSTWLGVTIVLIFQGTIHERSTPIAWFLVPVFTTLVLGAVSNALDVQFIPTKLRNWWQTGIRDRLWNSRVGEWLPSRPGGTRRSRAAGRGGARPPA